MPEHSKLVDVETDAARPHRFIFVLLDQFSMVSFATALDCLRIANRMSSKTLYTWHLIGEGGDLVSCSAGTTFKLDGDLGDVQRDDVVLLCSGVDVQRATSKRLLGWVRRVARQGVKIGGLCTGAYVLAKAGLLDGKKATIHWENADSFAEEFDEIELTKSVFVIDGNRMTTAGGTSSIDLLLKLIADEFGEDKIGRASCRERV